MTATTILTGIGWMSPIFAISVGATMTAVTVLIGIAVTILSANAAYFAAESRGREPSLWPTATMVLPVLFFVLLFLPRRDVPKQIPWYGLPFEIIGGAALLLFIGARIWQFAA